MLLPLTICIVLKDNKVMERISNQCHNVDYIEYTYITERKQSAGTISCFFFDAASLPSKMFCLNFLSDPVR